jgi:hypothetical protein
MAAPGMPMAADTYLGSTPTRAGSLRARATGILAVAGERGKGKKVPLPNGPWSYPAGWVAPSAGPRRTGATVGRPSSPTLTATLAA